MQCTIQFYRREKLIKKMLTLGKIEMTSKITIEYFGGTHYHWNIKCMFESVEEALTHLDTLYEFCGHERSGYKWKLIYRSDKAHFNGRDMKFSRLKADLYDLQELEKYFSAGLNSDSVSAASYSTSDTLSTTTYSESSPEQIPEDSFTEQISYDESEPLLNEPWNCSDDRIEYTPWATIPQSQPKSWTPWDFQPTLPEQFNQETQTPNSPLSPLSPPPPPPLPSQPLPPLPENLWESVEPDLEAGEWNDYDHVSESSAKIE